MGGVFRSVFGGSSPAAAPAPAPRQVDYAAEAAARKQEADDTAADARMEAINKKKKGRSSTLLTGGDGLGETAAGAKTLLGS